MSTREVEIADKMSMVKLSADIYVCMYVYYAYACLFDCINVKEEGNVYLTTHSTHFIYGYMASDMGYSFRLAAKIL